MNWKEQFKINSFNDYNVDNVGYVVYKIESGKFTEPASVDDLVAFIDSVVIPETIQKERERIITIIGTHSQEEYMGYCDTGSDMDFACRSECMNLAIERIRKSNQ